MDNFKEGLEDYFEPKVVCEWDKRQKCDSEYRRESRRLLAENDRLRRVLRETREWLGSEITCEKSAENGLKIDIMRSVLEKLEELEGNKK